MGTKTVLVIANIFPPAGGGGVQRTAKFVKYLPHFGWEPIVLTPNRVTSLLRDDSLLRDIPPNTRIIRTFTLEPTEKAERSFISYSLHGTLRVFSIPDLSIWWLPWGIWHGYRELRRKAVDAIYVTGSPFSSYFIGAALKKLTGIPLVIDFRDGWTMDPNYNFWRVLRWRNPIERFMQDAVISYADRVIVVAESMRDSFVSRYGGEEVFVTIRNGFDPDDFVEPRGCLVERGGFNIVYTGSLWIPSSRPDAFLRGVKRVLEEDTDVRKDLRVTIVGNPDRHSQALIRELGLEQWVKTVGYFPHLETIKHLLEADVLLLIVNYYELCIVPGKIYEYIAARKPVLALVPPKGEEAWLLTKAGSGILTDPQDVLDIRDKIRLLHRKWKDNDLDIAVNSEFIETLTRKRQTGLLASVLDEVVNSSCQAGLRRDSG